MCPRHITRKSYICLFGIVQANNKVYFNFLFSVVPFIEITPLGTLWEGAMRLGWDSNVPGPHPQETNTEHYQNFTAFSKTSLFL